MMRTDVQCCRTIGKPWKRTPTALSTVTAAPCVLWYSSISSSTHSPQPSMLASAVCNIGVPVERNFHSLSPHSSARRHKTGSNLLLHACASRSDPARSMLIRREIWTRERLSRCLCVSAVLCSARNIACWEFSDIFCRGIIGEISVIYYSLFVICSWITL